MIKFLCKKNPMVALENWKTNTAYDAGSYIYIVNSNRDQYVRIEKITGRINIGEMDNARSDFEAVEVTLEISIKE